MIWIIAGLIIAALLVTGYSLCWMAGEGDRQALNKKLATGKKIPHH